jgi:hypothetical protein
MPSFGLVLREAGQQADRVLDLALEEDEDAPSGTSLMYAS